MAFQYSAVRRHEAQNISLSGLRSLFRIEILNPDTAHVPTFYAPNAEPSWDTEAGISVLKPCYFLLPCDRRYRIWSLAPHRLEFRIPILYRTASMAHCFSYDYRYLLCVSCPRNCRWRPLHCAFVVILIILIPVNGLKKNTTFTFQTALSHCQNMWWTYYHF